MTLRTLIACASPLSSPNTVRDHLRATNCEDLGGGGITRFVPYTDLKIDVDSRQTSIDMEKKSLSIDKQGGVLNIETDSKVLSINLDLAEKEITQNGN